MDMKKALYYVLLGLEGITMFFPIFLIFFFHGFLISLLLFLAIAAVYAFLGIRAFKQKQAEDEAGLKKSKIIIALVCPVIWAAFIAYFFYVCEALGVI